MNFDQNAMISCFSSQRYQKGLLTFYQEQWNNQQIQPSNQQQTQRTLKVDKNKSSASQPNHLTVLIQKHQTSIHQNQNQVRLISNHHKQNHNYNKFPIHKSNRNFASNTELTHSNKKYIHKIHNIKNNSQTECNSQKQNNLNPLKSVLNYPPPKIDENSKSDNNNILLLKNKSLFTSIYQKPQILQQKAQLSNAKQSYKSQLSQLPNDFLQQKERRSIQNLKKKRPIKSIKLKYYSFECQDKDEQIEYCPRNQQLQYSLNLFKQKNHYSTKGILNGQVTKIMNSNKSSSLHKFTDRDSIRAINEQNINLKYQGLSKKSRKSSIYLFPIIQDCLNNRNMEHNLQYSSKDLNLNNQLKKRMYRFSDIGIKSQQKQK